MFFKKKKSGKKGKKSVKKFGWGFFFKSIEIMNELLKEYFII